MSQQQTLKEQFRREVPEGDHLERSICDHCGFIDYHNPRVVVGAIPVFEDKILLARRAIEPRRGFWTVPGGFMEKGESLQEGAARETWEECGAKIDVGPLLGMFTVPTSRRCRSSSTPIVPTARPLPDKNRLRLNGSALMKFHGTTIRSHRARNRSATS